MCISAQLKTFDRPSRDSGESQGQQRLALLENLEQEMGQEEDHWLEMQYGMGRDSISTVESFLDGDSLPETLVSTASPPGASQRNAAADQRASRRTQTRGGRITGTSSEMAAPSTQSSDRTHATRTTP